MEVTFRELDKDKDGMITAAEAQLVYTRRLKNLLVASEGELPKYFSIENIFWTQFCLRKKVLGKLTMLLEKLFS